MKFTCWLIFLFVSIVAGMSENSIVERPTYTRDSYEVCSSGPLFVHYLPNSEENPKKEEDKFAFQIKYGWAALLCSTAECFTQVICQSTKPVFISSTIDVRVEGVGVTVYLPSSVSLVKKNQAKYKEKTGDIIPPNLGIVVCEAADLSKFHEKVQAIISDGMTVYCQGNQRIVLTEDSETTLIRM